EDAATEAGIEGEEAAQRNSVNAAEGFDLRSASWTSAGNDVRSAIAIDVFHRHPHAASESGRISEEALQERPRAGEDLHMRPASTAGAGNDIRPAIAIHIARRDADPAGEGGRVGEEA